MLVAMTMMLIAPAELASGVSRAEAIGDPASWVTIADYPPSAIRAGEAGAVAFTLAIDASGRVTDCHVTQSSGHQSLDSSTCQILRQRAAFRPGAAARRYSSRIRWVLPPPTSPVEVMPDFPTTASAETEVVIGVTGLVESCRVVEAAKPMGDPCAATRPGQRQGAGFLKDGKPVKATIRRRMTVSTTFAAP